MPTGDDSKIIENKERRLQKLKERQATEGNSTPPEILTEIEDLEEEIADLHAQAEAARQALIMPTEERPLPVVRVFISSSPDVQQDAQQITRLLYKLSLDDVRLDVVQSQTTSPSEAKQFISQECDILIGVYGGKAGDPLPDDRLGRSAMELEFDLTCDLGKTIWVYQRFDVDVDEAQARFLSYVNKKLPDNHVQQYRTGELESTGQAWLQAMVTKELAAADPKYADRKTPAELVLLASLGLSPGAITGLYYALKNKGKRANRVITIAPDNTNIDEAVTFVAEELAQEAAYQSELLQTADGGPIRDISGDTDVTAFKSLFTRLMFDNFERGANIMVGLTGGRTILGALMAAVAQRYPANRVTLYHFHVDAAIEKHGHISELLKLSESSSTFREAMQPPQDKYTLVQVPFVRLPDSSADEA